MSSFIELRQKVEGLDAEDALLEVSRLIEAQGDSPESELLVMKSEILFMLSSRGGSAGYDHACQAREVITPLLENKLEPYYPYLLYMITALTLKIDGGEEAMPYAKEFLDTHFDDAEAKFLLALSLNDAGIDTEKGVQLIDDYLALTDDYQRGAPIKIEFLVDLDRFEEAEALLDFCAEAHPEREALWHEKRAYLYHKSGNFEGAYKSLQWLIGVSDDKKTRFPWFHNAAFVLENMENPDKRLREFLEQYTKDYPNDEFGFMYLAEIEAPTSDERLNYFRRAFEIDPTSCPNSLMAVYLRRGTKEDAEGYFSVYESLLADEESNHWGSVMNTVYGAFRGYDRGQSIRILEKDLLFEPDNECTYSLLGKIYECGIGTEIDLARAFDYYKKSYSLHEECGCGAVFLAYAYYYGVGIDRDKQRARELILEAMEIKERVENDPDRVTLYAIMAFEQEDKEFSKKRAIKLLKKHTDSLAPNLLLYQNLDEKEKAKYKKKFLQLIKRVPDLEKAHFVSYAEDLDREFYPFISN